MVLALMGLEKKTAEPGEETAEPGTRKSETVEPVTRNPAEGELGDKT
jgi:hypothetical protein